ncbi:kinase-like domain-containing protein [Vararia minispora EC-137]|uniref:Kinase-like domain-containing protein n=1 Tax=Vararia minispora EC-137 TaxID=1314806 RepID=A0ACB8QB69_9AGAM|nr:kinase-like domain-containing protein [Vararia minispora EC-137]
MANKTSQMNLLRDDELDPREVRWRDRQPYLESKGYMLRPRYRPGWTPSWYTTGKQPRRSEDGLKLPLRSLLVDATRISDGKLVYIKQVKTDDLESSIALVLSSPAMRSDSRNHSVPILDHFSDLEDTAISYIVMPFLRNINYPPMIKVVEVVDFVDQILEGLVFMHEQGVAHRDCATTNILMDSSTMYPLGFHPIRQSCLPDGFTLATPLPRHDVGVTYYFIDYGISSYFPPGQPRGLVVGDFGRDQDVPELSETVPYDPFAVDIFIIGNQLRLAFHEKYTNVGFLKPIIDCATALDPARRPSAQELLRFWSKRRKQISSLAKEWPLKERDQYAINVIRDCAGALHLVLRFLRSLFA